MPVLLFFLKITLMVNDINLRACAFIVVVKDPMATMTRICELMTQKKIIIDTLHFQLLESGHAKLVIHCLLEKDKIGYIGRHFEEMNGVEEVNWMNARARTKQY
ncbi:MAG: hypothetical protein ABI675_17860 [Chitinophagaceae bacterium]